MIHFPTAGPSNLTNFNFWVWILQFGARVVDAELPVDPGLFAIALLGPDRGFRRDQSPALEPAIQALAVQRTELQFRDVQPSPVFRRVHPVDAVVQSTGFGHRERSVERVTAVGVQVVVHQRDGFHIPVNAADSPACETGFAQSNVVCRLDDGHRPSAGQRLAEHPNRACSPGGGSGRRTAPATRGVPAASRELPPLAGNLY